MTVSANDPRPPYVQMADVLRREIKDGTHSGGDRLPSYRELEERFGVANMTARSALRVLREEGLIYTVQGRGSFVTDDAGSASQPGASTVAAADDEPNGASTLLLDVRDQLREVAAALSDLKLQFDALESRVGNLERQSGPQEP